LISNHFRDSVGGPEKAGVCGSIPSVATIPFNDLAIAKKACKNFSREQYANIGFLYFAFGVARSNNFDIHRAVLLFWQ